MSSPSKGASYSGNPIVIVLNKSLGAQAPIWTLVVAYLATFGLLLLLQQPGAGVQTGFLRGLGIAGGEGAREGTPCECPASRGDAAVLENGDVSMRKDVCVNPAFALEGPESPYYYLKTFPAPAPCTVRGMVIDKLEPWFNYRRPITLRRTQDPDPDYLVPYFRGFQDLSLMTRKRRVLLDLGANAFSTSTSWFLKNYPLDFTEIHAFEVVHGRFRMPKPKPKEKRPPPVTDLYETINARSEIKREYAELPIPDEMLDTVTLYEAFVGTEDKPGEGSNPPSINITRFIKEELKLTKDDSVIVKMDIEWAEWDVLPAWLQDKEMPDILDEIFVEFHYQHPTTYLVGWRKGPQREAADKLFKEMREAGFFIHPWV